MGEVGKVYGDGTNSSVGPQLQDMYFQKKALIDLKKDIFFGPLADTFNMPKHYGKTIKRYHYIPILDDRNLNDQGIDAAGAITQMTKWYVFVDGALVPDATIATNSAGFADEATAIAAMTDTATQVTTKGSGFLYGSSKDVGVIRGKAPLLSENGGRVNRVGNTRVTLEGTFHNYGFFEEYTKDSVDFDSDAGLRMHVNREMIRGAQEISEDLLQSDILGTAGTVRYSGAATSRVTISGEVGSICEVTYGDLSSLNIDLDNNRTPKELKMITGTNLTDTLTIPAARAMMIGSEMQQTLERMVDFHGDKAFIPVQKYASGTKVLNGEIGTVGQFRIVVVPEMQSWAGGGGAVSTNAGYKSTNDKYDVFPLLVIGSESFTTIGFQSGAKGGSKFLIYNKKPGEGTVTDRDPYGKKGLMSIQWWYGFMALRPERIALIYSVGRLG